MTNEQRIKELIRDLNESYSSMKKVTALMWNNEEWEQERARIKKIKKELKEIITLRIKELEEEYATLDNRYSKFMKFKFKVLGVPKVVGVDQQRMREITHEIQDLNTLIKSSCHIQ